MATNKNFSQHWEGFPDVDYEWGQDDVYFSGFVNTHVQDKMEAEYYTNVDGAYCLKATDTVTDDVGGDNERVIPVSQALTEGLIDCSNLCEDARATFGFKKNCKKAFNTKKAGAWITNFLAGTGLYRPIPTYDPNNPNQSTNTYQGNPLYGCMNPNALNYNPMANQDDGSCQLKQGLSPWAWAGIGVGGLLLIVGIVAIVGGGGSKKGAPRRRVVDLNDPTY